LRPSLDSVPDEDDLFPEDETWPTTHDGRDRPSVGKGVRLVGVNKQASD